MKYKVGDTVWMKSNWFAGAYIPDCFVVAARKVCNGKNQYRKKSSRTWWDEDSLFPTEEECQRSEIQRFIEDTRKEVAKIVSNARLIGIASKVRGFLVDPTSEQRAVFGVGDEVWGWIEKDIFDYTPKKYTISKVMYLPKTKGHTYNLKGHGTLMVFGTYLYRTQEDAVLAAMRILHEKTIERAKVIKRRCESLGLPFENVELLTLK